MCEKRVQLLSGEHGNEAKVRPSRITFQYLYELCVHQWWAKVIVEHQSAMPRSPILLSADDAIILAKFLKVLLVALEALYEKPKPLGLIVWRKTNVQTFRSLMDEIV